MAIPSPWIMAAALVVALSTTARAQGRRGQDTAWRADSTAIEHTIAERYPTLPLSAAARRLLLSDLRSGARAEPERLLRYIARRAPGWLSGAEQLNARALLGDTALLRDTARLAGLLESMRVGPRANPAYDDGLYTVTTAMIRGGADQVAERLDERAPYPDERFFFNLLINHLFIHGYRAQAELNDRVEQFARRYPGSPLVGIARRYIAMPYSEAPFGAAFSFGYGLGWFTGNLSDAFNLFSGPTLGGEFYVRRATVAFWFTFGGARAPEPMTIAGHDWVAGTAQLSHVALDAGYELRMGRLAITPLAGLAIQNLRAPDTSGADIGALPSSGDRLGLDLSAIVGWRIPFDTGPHLDLRVRLGLATTTLGDYDPRLSGTLWYIQFCLALVQRPYQGS